MRILHVLHHSEPYLDGYGVRSKSILEFQHRLGLSPVVVTSAQHEIEVKRGTSGPALEEINGIRYYRTPLASGAAAEFQLKTPFLRERILMRSLDRTLAQVLQAEPVDVVHAHSPVLCGLPALKAARARRLPLVYEVRAFWEDAMLSSRPSLMRSLKYGYSRRLESSLFRKADAVVAISQHMLHEIAARGIPASRLHQVPNGVDADRFSPSPPDRPLAEQLGLGSGPVVGFIGSFFNFEGLDCLVRAMPAILGAVPAAKLVLVGTGEAAETIGDLVTKLGLNGSVIRTGRVPHDQVLRYYSVMDVMVYPRHSERVTEFVTPLKPLEAMAFGKPVVGSDVGGVRELLGDGTAGVLFKAGDSDDLARAVIPLLSDPARRETMSAAATK